MSINDELAKAKERLNAYYEAESKILQGQSYTINGRTLTRANLTQISQQINKLKSEIRELEAAASGKGYRKVFRAVPRDL